MKFRKRGNKEGALAAFYQLEEDGLGKLLEVQGSNKEVTFISMSFHYKLYITFNNVVIWHARFLD